MPVLAKNVQTVFSKYNTHSYSEGCSTYMNSDETSILCIIVNDRERGKLDITKIAEKLYLKGHKHSSIRASYQGNSLKDFNTWLSKHFKLKA